MFKTFFDKYNRYFHKQFEIIFIDERPVILDTKDIVDIILSPKYYWVKIEKLPVKFSFQAKEYANSIFDNNIPKANYSYKVIKSDDNFIFFAYDIKMILENLSKLGINQAQIRNVYFSQTEFKNDIPIKIDNNYALILHNDKVIKTPINLVKEHMQITNILNSLELSNNNIKLGKFNQIYEQKSILGILFVLFFLIIIFIGEIFYLQSLLKKKVIRKDEIVAKYSLPNTKIQINAIANQYKNIQQTQVNLRAKIDEIFKLSFLEDEYISDLKVNNQKITLTLHIEDNNRINYFRQSLERHFNIDSFREHGSNIEFGMTHE